MCFATMWPLLEYSAYERRTDAYAEQLKARAWCLHGSWLHFHATGKPCCRVGEGGLE